MKNLIHPFKYKVLPILLVAISISSCKNNSEEKTVEKETGKTEYPAEWMYNQRAYPNNYINKDAYKEAITQSKQIVANRSSQASGEWTYVGPLNVGGRITDVAIAPDNDDHLYLAAASGGIFRSYDRGVNWTPIFDGQARLSIGDIAIAPSNSQIIYAGTGEANGSASDGAYFGDGIYRSNDAGDSWTNVGLPDSNHIGRIVIDPNNPDRVFVAATGQLYGKNVERGIYRTTNAGGNWERVLFTTDSTSAIDVAMNVANTNIIYAAMWERTRKPFQRDFGGVSSALHRSTDGGTTWTELGTANGLPAPDAKTGRIGIAVSESNPSTVYARYTTNETTNVFNGLYKSTDNGDNWTLVTSAGALSLIDGHSGWYFGNVRVNPTNANEVYILGLEMAKSTDGGMSWQILSGMHNDHHALDFSRTNSNFILAGNDGGANLSINGGNGWMHFTNLPITQFYKIEVDYQHPERLYGGSQDNGTIRTLTGDQKAWRLIHGGDGFYVNVDPIDNSYVYAEAQYGDLSRATDGGVAFENATVGINSNDRINWNAPVILSPFSPDKMFYGSNRLYTSTRAVSWTPISPDLTDGPKPSGIMAVGTLTAIAASYNNLDVIYTGSDDGNVNVTFDGGTTWTNISAGLPDQYITSIAMVPNNDMIAYVTLSGFKYLNYTPRVFKTTDGGQNWTDISSNLPNIPVNGIITYPAENILFVATDLNVWFSQDDGANWTVLGNNLPFTVVMDLKFHAPTKTLYAGTYGRGMYSYDMKDIVGVNENELASDSIKVYPNPATSEFTISHNLTSEGNVQLFDNSGKKIKDLFRGNFSANKNINVKTDGIAAGIYLLKVNSGKQSITKKLIVNK